MGDWVSHWEGDTLVTDTVGVKMDNLTPVDRFGTPQSIQMHGVERYRLIDGALAKAQIDKCEPSEAIGGGGRDAGCNPDTQGIAAGCDHGGPQGLCRALDRTCHLPALDLGVGAIGLRRQPPRNITRMSGSACPGQPARFLTGTA